MKQHSTILKWLFSNVRKAQRDGCMVPFVRQPRGGTGVALVDKRRAVAQRAVEIAERRAVFDANNKN